MVSPAEVARCAQSQPRRPLGDFKRSSAPRGPLEPFATCSECSARTREMRPEEFEEIFTRQDDALAARVKTLSPSVQASPRPNTYNDCCWGHMVDESIVRYHYINSLLCGAMADVRTEGCEQRHGILDGKYCNRSGGAPEEAATGKGGNSEMEDQR
ncbi:hypothetical protein VUR80DRAFT_7337 [Thermomyces stellatus]